MFAVVSPAKSLNLDPSDRGLPSSTPVLLDEAERLARTCRNNFRKRYDPSRSMSVLRIWGV